LDVIVNGPISAGRRCWKCVGRVRARRTV